MNGTADDGKDPLWEDLEQVQDFYNKHELVKVDCGDLRFIVIGLALLCAHFSDGPVGLGVALVLGYVASTAMQFSYVRRRKS